ncbi:hypothetical protein, partial [Flavivirga algicola]
TLFGSETAAASGDSTTETIDGITLTVTNNNVGSGFALTNWGGWNGSTDTVANSGTTTSITFTFSEPVDINSILPINGSASSIVYSLTRLDGSGSSPVDVTMDSGGGAPGLVPVDLNW